MIGTLHSSTSASNAFPKICFTPSHACCQFPVNTPQIKSISPWNIPITFVTIFPSDVNTADIPPRIAGPTTLPTCIKMVRIVCMAGMICKIAFPIPVATVITAFPTVPIIWLTIGAMVEKKFISMGAAVVESQPKTLSKIGFTVCVPNVTICCPSPTIVCPMFTRPSNAPPAPSPKMPTMPCRTIARFSGLNAPTIVSFTFVIVPRNPSNTATPCVPNTFPMIVLIPSKLSPRMETTATMEPSTPTTGSAPVKIDPNAPAAGASVAAPAPARLPNTDPIPVAFAAPAATPAAPLIAPGAFPRFPRIFPSAMPVSVLAIFPSKPPAAPFTAPAAAPGACRTVPMIFPKAAAVSLFAIAAPAFPKRLSAGIAFFVSAPLIPPRYPPTEFAAFPAFVWLKISPRLWPIICALLAPLIAWSSLNPLAVFAITSAALARLFAPFPLLSTTISCPVSSASRFGRIADIPAPAPFCRTVCTIVCAAPPMFVHLAALLAVCLAAAPATPPVVAAAALFCPPGNSFPIHPAAVSISGAKRIPVHAAPIPISIAFSCGKWFIQYPKNSSTFAMMFGRSSIMSTSTSRTPSTASRTLSSS